MKAPLAVLGSLAAVFGLLAVAAVVLGAGQREGACSLAASLAPSGEAGSWLATAYGPPWGRHRGDGITATGLNLTAGQPALEVAVDPRLIALGSYVHVQPNPFGTTGAFYAGDTGGAITGQHVDIYDWHGRAGQDAWGQRAVSVTPAPEPRRREPPRRRRADPAISRRRRRLELSRGRRRRKRRA